MSLALEMSGEPQKAALRVLSARALEIEAGPVSGLFREEQMAPASNVAFIRQVWIRSTGRQSTSFVRARAHIDAPGAGNVRVVGRTVYVDFMPVTTFRPELRARPVSNARRSRTATTAATERAGTGGVRSVADKRFGRS